MESNVLEEEPVAEFFPTTAEGVAIAGICAFSAALGSLYQIYLHATHYEDAIIQKYYIRIIFLIPNYAFCSFLSLVIPSGSIYIETIRDMYEAFVIYTFFALLLEYIGGPGNVETFCRDKTLKGSCGYGTCIFPPMQVDGQFVKMMKRLVLQFVILRPILAVITIALSARGYYKEGTWTTDSGYLWLQVIYNFTYGAALLGLIHFWAGTRDLLVPYKPVLKFVTVKGVVFITFWQGLIISLLMLGSPNEHAGALQTWLLCVEMVVAAILMWLAFPAKPYIEAASGRQHAQGQGGDMLRAVQNVGDVVMLTDVVTDLKHQFKPQYNTYTMYTNMDAEDGAASRSPTDQSGRPNTSTEQANPYHKDRIDAGKF